MSASEINKVCFRKRRSHLLQGATVWTRVVGPRSKKENSIHIKNGRGHISRMGEDISRMGEDIWRMGEDLSRMAEDISRIGEGASWNWMEEEGEEQDKKEMSASW